MPATSSPSNGAVLVLGGGAAGVRCALDLAEAGHKVILVERKGSLGGHMSRLDKAFPYNKCALCTLTPKLKQVMQEPGIEVVTSAELTALEGETGAFTAHITRHPRFVDPAACTTCGDCVPACPVTLPNDFNDGMGTRRAIGKPYQHAIPTVFTVIKRGHSPCKLACPLPTRAQGSAPLARQGRLPAASPTTPAATPCVRDVAATISTTANIVSERLPWSYGYIGCHVPTASSCTSSTGRTTTTTTTTCAPNFYRNTRNTGRDDKSFGTLGIKCLP